MADTAAHLVSEVPEERAEGDIRGIYQDIKSTLRVPLVHSVFRTLALEPDYLRIAWRQLRTNAQTVYFEERADGLRRFAVDAVSRMGERRTPVYDPDIGEVVRAFNYGNPKVMLAVAALRSATVGQLPKLAELPAEAKRQIALGVPENMVTPDVVTPERADDRIRRIFSDLQTTLGIDVISSDYQALACWPDFLEPAWLAWKPFVGTPEYRAMQRDMRRMAEEAVVEIPFRMDLNPHTLRLCGLSEGQIDAVRSILDRFYMLLPGLVANMAFLSIGIEGKGSARESPFPVSTI